MIGKHWSVFRWEWWLKFHWTRLIFWWFGVKWDSRTSFFLIYYNVKVFVDRITEDEIVRTHVDFSSFDFPMEFCCLDGVFDDKIFDEQWSYSVIENSLFLAARSCSFSCIDLISIDVVCFVDFEFFDYYYCYSFFFLSADDYWEIQPMQ